MGQIRRAVESGLQVEDNGVKQGQPNSTSIAVFAVKFGVWEGLRSQSAASLIHGSLRYSTISISGEGSTLCGFVVLFLLRSGILFK